MLNKELKKKEAPKLLKSQRQFINLFLNITINFILYKTLTNFYIYIHQNKNPEEYSFWKFIAPVLLTSIISTNIFYITLYKLKIKKIENMKTNNLNWPWEKNLEKFKKKIPEVLKTYLLNAIILFPTYIYFALKYFPCRFDIKSLPNFFEFYMTFVFSFLIEDFISYWAHRTLHHPKLYYIHKKHHEFPDVIHISSIYTHWIDFMIGGAFAINASLLIFQKYIHLISLVGFIFLKIFEVHQSHSGYDFFFNVFDIFPFMANGDYHNFHHLYNTGNFGTYTTIWDSFFGTDKEYKLSKLKN